MAYIDDLIKQYFPSSKHPYHLLKAAIDLYVVPGSSVLEVGCRRTVLCLSPIFHVTQS